MKKVLVSLPNEMQFNCFSKYLNGHGVTPEWSRSSEYKLIAYLDKPAVIYAVNLLGGKVTDTNISVITKV
jgi:hypothetical protein